MNYIKEILKGILIGIANIIPGVSGGTMAVSMGIYDKIIGSITNLFRNFKKSISTLLPYLIGMGIGIIGLSFIIESLFANFPLQTSMIFIGLILGGLPILIKRVKGNRIGISNVIIFVLFFALIVGLQLLGEGNKEIVLNINVMQIFLLFFIGVIASATMVIPGVSGSMILMILGYYNPIVQTINSFIKALVHFDIPVLLHGIGILVPFGIGVVVGIFAIAKVVELLLNHFRGLTYCAILGLVIASPIAILISAELNNINSTAIITSIVTFIIGFVIAYLLGKESE